MRECLKALGKFERDFNVKLKCCFRQTLFLQEVKLYQYIALLSDT